MEKKTKRIIITSLSIVLSSSVLIGGYILYKDSRIKFAKDLEKSGISVISGCEYGTLDFESKPLFKNSNKNVFSYVKCGNHLNELSAEAKKLLLDEDVPTGIIIETNAKSLADIYLDVDYAKEIISSYNVKELICLDINYMFECNVDVSNINVIVNAFVDKMNANSCLVKIIGYDDNMKMLQDEKSRAELAGEEVPINYDLGLVLRNNKYEGVSLKYQMVFGNKYIYSDKNYKDIIEKGNNNNSQMFYDDYIYVARDTVDIDYVSSVTGLSKSNIMEYNNISSDILLTNEKVIIPSKYHSPYWKGIDISSNQVNVDFDLMKKNVDFAIFRAGASDDGINYVDTNFNHNATNCEKLSIPYGAYYYTTATNEEQIDKEIRVLSYALEGHNPELPIFIDIEGKALNLLESDNLDVSSNQINLIRIYCEKISEAGYKPGIYINNSRVELLSEFIGVYPIWACGGYAYDEEQRYDSMYIQNDLNQGVVMFQTSRFGMGDVIGIEDYIDYNYADGNYMSEILPNTKRKEKKIN